MEDHQTNSKSRFVMKWWGWGDPSHRISLRTKPGIAPYLKKYFQCQGLENSDRVPLSLSDFILPAPALDKDDVDKLISIVGSEGICMTDEDRLIHSYGKSYKDIIHLRLNKISHYVDAVVYPQSEQEVSGLFKYAQQANIAIIPFGGGSSVVGGVEVIKRNHDKVIAADLGRMNKLINIDLTSMVATFQCGIFGPALEEVLSNNGLTLGHFPQSFEFSTLGGWIAARSSGQNSAGYGAIEMMVVSLTMVTPNGDIRTRLVPREATGPSIKELLIGSEGIFGIITSASIRVSALPREKHYVMYAVPNFKIGADMCRTLTQQGYPMHMLRLSDESETEAFLAMGKTSDKKSLTQYLAKKYLQYKHINLNSFCTLLIGCEGERDHNLANQKKIKACLEKNGAVYLGTGPGQKWLKDRFALPYLRDEFMNVGLLVDTLETSTTWSNLFNLYAKVGETVASVFNRQHVSYKLYTHISHVYEVGASLYFTLIANQTQTPCEQWFEVKEAVNKAIVDAGGTISHHHGVGVDHAAYAFPGALEKCAIQNLKKQFDPKGIMNPGKILE